MTDPVNSLTGGPAYRPDEIIARLRRERDEVRARLRRLEEHAQAPLYETLDLHYGYKASPEVMRHIRRIRKERDALRARVEELGGLLAEIKPHVTYCETGMMPDEMDEAQAEVSELHARIAKALAGSAAEKCGTCGGSGEVCLGADDRIGSGAEDVCKPCPEGCEKEG